MEPPSVSFTVPQVQVHGVIIWLFVEKKKSVDESGWVGVVVVVVWSCFDGKN
jgi:hypothetical protein